VFIVVVTLGFYLENGLIMVSAYVGRVVVVCVCVRWCVLSVFSEGKVGFVGRCGFWLLEVRAVPVCLCPMDVVMTPYKL
jgi:hypothetical protein